MTVPADENDGIRSDGVKNAREASARVSGLLLAVVWWVVVLFPALPAVVIFSGLAVNVPTWDDWERGPLLRKWDEGRLGFSDLYAAHIQHRTLLPRMLTIALDYVSGGDLRWEMACTWLIVAATAACTGILLLRSLGRTAGSACLGMVITAVLFSPLQFQNFLWAFQTAYVMPGFFLSVALVVWTSRLAFTIRILSLLACAILSTHTFAHGMMTWVAALPLLMLWPAGPGGWRGRLAVSGMWVAAGSIVLGCYFSDLHNTAHPSHAYADRTEGGSSGRVLIADPARGIAFFLRMIGSPLSRGVEWSPMAAALSIGAAIVALLAVAWGILLLRRRDRSFLERALPWLVLGIFGIACAAAVTWGRAGVSGPSRALTPRYMGMSQFALIALLPLIPVFVGVRNRALPFAAGIAVAWMAVSWSEGVELSKAWSSARRQARAQLALINVVRPTACTLVDGDADFLEEQVRYLDRTGRLKPSPLSEPWLDGFAVRKRALSKSSNQFHPVEWTRDGFAIISGFAHAPGGKRPADAVLLCTREGDRWKIRAIADPDIPEGRESLLVDYEFTPCHRPRRRVVPGWRIVMNESLDIGQEWSAWVLDTKKWSVHRIPGDPLARPSSEG